MRRASYPAEPVLKLLHGLDITAAAHAAGVPRRTIYNWQKNGVIGARVADRVAVTLGHHPSELWSDWYGNAPSGSSR